MQGAQHCAGPIIQVRNENYQEKVFCDLRLLSITSITGRGRSTRAERLSQPTSFPAAPPHPS